MKLVAVMTWCATLTASAAPEVREAAQEVRVGPWKGAPALFRGDRPEFPLFHFSQEILDDYAREFHKAGFIFYASIDEHAFLDLGWVGDYEFNFGKLDRLLTDFQRRLPEAYIMPKVHVWAPEWWIDRYPEEAVGLLRTPETYEYRIGSGPKHESFASERWQAEVTEGLRRMVRHILGAPYRDRVMGIMVAGGTFGEWHPWDWEHVPDSSEPMRRAFARYVERKYRSDLAALRAAWNDPEATFEGVTVPDLAERRTPHLGLFRDPARSRRVPDYYEAFHQVTVDMLDRFCRAVKDESDGRLLTCVDYAYQPDMPYVSQETTTGPRQPPCASRASTCSRHPIPTGTGTSASTAQSAISPRA